MSGTNRLTRTVPRNRGAVAAKCAWAHWFWPPFQNRTPKCFPRCCYTYFRREDHIDQHTRNHDLNSAVVHDITFNTKPALPSQSCIGRAGTLFDRGFDRFSFTPVTTTTYTANSICIAPRWTGRFYALLCFVLGKEERFAPTAEGAEPIRNLCWLLHIGLVYSSLKTILLQVPPYPPRSRL